MSRGLGDVYKRQVLDHWALWVSGWPGAQIWFDTAYAAVVCLLLAGLCWLAFHNRVRLRVALPALLLTAGLAVFTGNALNRDVVRVELVGSRNAPAVVISRNESAVILFRGGDVTRSAVETTLERRNIRTVECLIDLRVDAYIPETYIADGPGRIEAYKRIAAIQTPEDAADVLDELIDRYGDPPPSVSDLVNVSLARVQATAVGVYEVTQKKDTIVLNLEHLDVPMIRGLLVAFNGRVVTGAGAKPYLSVTLQKEEKPLELLQSILKAMAEILAQKS